MKRYILALTIALLTTVGCMGIPLPGTDYRLMNWPIESRRVEINSTCIDLAELSIVAEGWEERHLNYIQTKDEAVAIDIGDFVASFGELCQARFNKLDVPKIKTELFGDIQTIADSNKLRELGGVAFAYQDVSKRTGIELSLHIQDHSKGPHRRLVAIYRLGDSRVIHYNYAGTDNVDKKLRRWPIDEFFGMAVRAAGKAIIP
jgi:hypothetical protein